MKRNLFRLVAVLTAFFIGVAINNSCGDTQKDPANPTTQELWNAVRALAEETSQLKTEVQQLRGKVDALEGGGATGGDNSGEFLVDGLYFNRNGFVSSKQKRSTSSGETTSYTYDNKGRIRSWISQSAGSTITYTFDYSGKTSTQTYAIVYNPAVYPNTQNSTTATTTEYY